MEKWVDFREGRERYKINELGSLYIAKKWSSDIPTIFIGGQMEHKRHNVEKAIGRVPEPGYAMFDGCWAYEYPTNDKDKGRFNAINFSDSLLALLKEAGIKKVNLMTESYGGTIGAYASISDRIHKVVAVHPPILGSPLAWPDLLKLDLTARQKFFAFIAAKVVVNSRYGFQKDNGKPTDLSRVDLNKLIVVGSNLDPSTDRNRILKETYDIIMAASGKASDGVVIYDEGEFDRLGINYFREKKPTNHEDASHTEAIEEAYKLTLK